MSEQTYIHGTVWRFEYLFKRFFEILRRHAHPQLDHLPGDIVVGRPVEYAGNRPDAATPGELPAYEQWRQRLAGLLAARKGATA